MTNVAGVPGSPVQLNIHGAVAIPVGHRIEVRVFFSHGDHGVFGTGIGQSEPKPMLETPLVTDLETGVVYGHLFYFHQEVMAVAPGSLFRPSPTLLPDLREHSRWIGKVLVCNVMYQGYGSPTREIQTTMVVEPILTQEAGAAYR